MLQDDIRHNDDSCIGLEGTSISPVGFEKRVLTPSRIVGMWFSMAISISLFVQSAQLYKSISVFQIVLALFVAYTLLCILMSLTQDIGIKYGIPFAVALRPAFGYIGSFLPTYCKALPATFWFGFQTWIAAEGINTISEIIFGYSNVSAFILLLCLFQIFHTCLGIKAISRFSNVASSTFLIIGLYIMYTLLLQNNITLLEVLIMQGMGEEGFGFPGAVFMYIGGWAAVAISIMDITKECKITVEEAENWWKSTRRFSVAQWIGLVPSAILFGLIATVGFALTGEWHPIRIIIKTVGKQNSIILVICIFFFVIATWSTNVIGTLYPTAYAITATLPNIISFNLATIIAGILGLLIRPWALAEGILDVAVTIGALIAPAYGIFVCDYYILRKRKINIVDLYNTDGQYKYWNNINPAAILAFIVGCIVSVQFWDYVFFIGAIVGGTVYYFLMKYWIIKLYPQKDIMQS